MEPRRGAPQKQWHGRGTRPQPYNEEQEHGSSGRGYGGRGRGHGGRGRGGQQQSNNNWHRGGRPMNSDGPRTSGPPRTYNLSFTKLKQLTEEENNNVVRTLANKAFNFDTLLQQSLSPDMFLLVVKNLAKVCLSDFEQDRVDILKTAFNGDKFIMQFPTMVADADSRNPAEAKDFIINTVLLFEHAARVLPVVCCRHVQTMKATSYGMMALDDKYQWGMDQNGPITSFKQTIEELQKYQQEVAEDPRKTRSEQWKERQMKLHGEVPPNDFRKIPVFPDPHELLDERLPYLRVNLVNQSYLSVEHYLDVQFRLMREDYVRPLREGITAINSKDLLKIKQANVRMYDNISFVRETSKKIPAALLKKKRKDVEGTMVCLNFDVNKKLKRTEWEHCRTFMFGSLLCFSADDFKNIHLATVVDRDLDYLKAGFLKIQFCELPKFDFYNHKFKMIESEVFFDPYNHVLQTLQKFSEEDFPFADYIVKCQEDVFPPSYLEVEPPIKYKFPRCPYPVTMLETNTWPMPDDLGLDDSQYQALYVGLTKELAVIQGPPGTGKTFLGLKLAQILIENREASKRSTPILVVCLTNHALDQFLVGIKKFTKKIVRIGGQSKNEEMNDFNLRLLRRRTRFTNSRYGDAKRELEANQRQLLSLDSGLKEFDKGIITFTCLVSNECAPKHLFHNDRQFLGWLLNRDQELLATTIGDLTFALTLDDLADVKGNQLEAARMEKLAGFVVKMMELQPADKNRARNMMKNVQALGLEDRWRLYLHWCDMLRQKMLANVSQFERDIARVNKSIDELQNVEDLEILREADVVGLTTSGAARLHDLLKNLGSEIVIVEEAAEVMETHVISCLTKSCLHLILIGDHKQLRPSVAVYNLAKSFNFDISLFERMVNRAPDQCVTLSMQYRMAPPIAALISPAIYKDLKNGENVKRYPEIKGCEKRLYFVDHKNPEMKMDNLDSHSKVNEFEATFLLWLCRHLIFQGYDQSQITILATYRGQMFHMRKERSKLFTDLDKVLITVVDNYQGEENDIILLSLVRSNEDYKIGFLSLENRVNVALSRAKHGLYIVGNMSCLSANTPIWKSVNKSLEDQNAIGPALPIVCTIHPDQTSLIRCGADFGSKSPQGGCTQMCNAPLECSHLCQSLCHVASSDHKDVRCVDRCIKKCANVKHQCPRKCYEDCGPCRELVTKNPVCGHTVQLPCCDDNASFICNEIVEKLFPKCGHTPQVPCHADPARYRCPEKCDRRLDSCGHNCGNTCHIDNDPDHLNFKCSKVCNKVNPLCSTQEHRCGKRCLEPCQPCPVSMIKKRICGHEVQVACSADPDAEGVCNKMCTNVLPLCGHKCTKPCIDNCEPCEEKVEVDHPVCGHKVTKLCGQHFDEITCTSKCNKKLRCGHMCKDPCGVTCSTTGCAEPVASVRAECGHNVLLHCSEHRAGLRVPKDPTRCTQPCGTNLECGHPCPGTCGSCYQGRFHELCNQPCGRSLICNHTCKEMCATTCPPCKEKCSLRCEHSKCPKICGEPCMPCLERCSSGCEHGFCHKPCGAKCDIDPCKEPCSKKLKCDHQCVGMCGEVCPPICRICDKDELTEIFFGMEDEPDARFVYLPECKHSIEIQGMDQHMRSGDDADDGRIVIKIKECPKCKTRVTAKRYWNAVKASLDDVNKVKIKYFGKPEENEKQRTEMLTELQDLIKAQRDLNTHPDELLSCLHRLLEELQPVIKDRRNVVHAYSLRAKRIELDILSSVCGVWRKCQLPELKQRIDVLLKIFVSKAGKFGQQQVTDFTPELQRLQYIGALLNFKQHIQYYPDLSNIINEGLYLEPNKRFSKHAEERMKILVDKAKTLCRNLPGLGITEVERVAIVGALGLTPGHWFKCPKGHPYAIGECGGAMVEATCPEPGCGARIGGENHQLRRDNTHFREMDNSRFPAWSEQANDMRNFNIDD